MDAIKEPGKKKVSVIAVDEQELRAHVSEVVRQSVEGTLNGLLEAEADALCQARRYERNARRASTRAGHYGREFQTKAGTVQLKVPKLRHVPFETAIIERYRRRESSVEEALVEMYLAGVSVRRVEDTCENAALSGLPFWSRTRALVFWKRLASFTPRLPGSAAWCIFTAMCCTPCLGGRAKRWR